MLLLVHSGAPVPRAAAPFARDVCLGSVGEAWCAATTRALIHALPLRRSPAGGRGLVCVYLWSRDALARQGAVFLEPMPLGFVHHANLKAGREMISRP